jgi:hypothetical protein
MRISGSFQQWCPCVKHTRRMRKVIQNDRSAPLAELYEA